MVTNVGKISQEINQEMKKVDECQINAELVSQVKQIATPLFKFNDLLVMERFEENPLALTVENA
jgi:hypothetical protein